MEISEIKALIESGIPGAEVEVTGDGCSCETTVISDAFEGVSLIKRHKMVMQNVSKIIESGELHALAIKAKTPAEVS